MKGKALSVVALLSFLFVVSAPVFADLSGTAWDIEAVVKAKVKIKGIGSDSDTESAVDQFEFYEGGGFDMVDASGTWRMAGKKFYVDLDTDALAEDLKVELEGALWDEDIDAEVRDLVITQNDFSGKENKNSTIKGKWKLAFQCSIYVDSVGRSFVVTAKTTTSFTGTPAGTADTRGLASPVPRADRGEPAAGATFEAIATRVRQAVAGLAPLP